MEKTPAEMENSLRKLWQKFFKSFGDTDERMLSALELFLRDALIRVEYRHLQVTGVHTEEALVRLGEHHFLSPETIRGIVYVVRKK